jgi:hypothetical protein
LAVGSWKLGVDVCQRIESQTCCASVAPISRS